ncbi:MAG: hypothetical protein AAF845_17535, partial [Bacteroidota bacterium]
AQALPPRGPAVRIPLGDRAVSLPEAIPAATPGPEAVPDEPTTRPAPAPMELLATRPPTPLETATAAAARDVAGIPTRLGVMAPAPEAEGVRLVVASGAVGTEADVADGASVAAGVSREWAVGRAVSVSGGALLAYGRVRPEADDVDVSAVLGNLRNNPGETAEIEERQVVTTVAVEIPVDVTVDVVRTPQGRLRASVGLTSALYLDQRFEDEGTRYASESIATDTDGSFVALSSDPFASEESVGALGRLDLGRQLNLGVGLAGDGPNALGVDVYVRLPLGGVTSRDLPLTVAGVQLRVPLR